MKTPNMKKSLNETMELALQLRENITYVNVQGAGWEGRRDVLVNGKPFRTNVPTDDLPNVIGAGIDVQQRCEF